MTLKLKANGHTLTIHGAPEPRNRIEPGITRLLSRIRATKDETATWNDLRQLALEVGVFIDPLDDQPEPPDKYTPLSKMGLGLR
jgi:hypothetical protein